MVINERLQEILSYCSTRDEEATCKFFDIAYSTLERYKRRARELNLKFKDKYENPKILLLDIETSPIEVEIWTLGKQYLYDPKLIKKNRSLLTWSAKWLCDNKIMGEKVTPNEAINRKDKKIVIGLWNLLEEADIIIGHNIKHFDEPIMKARFILNGLPPVSPYQVIDTCKHARKEFGFLSNKLDYLGRVLANTKKIHTDRELWTRCINGENKALEEMLKYNKHDVTLLEEVYFKLRPWMHSHPNLGLYYEDMSNRCPNCSSKNLSIQGNYYTTVNRYNAIKCRECGAYGRERINNVNKKNRKGLLGVNAR